VTADKPARLKIKANRAVLQNEREFIES